MNATTVPALTSALATRLAKAAAPELRWTSERAANGGRLVRVWDAALEGDRTELRLLNDARDLIRAVGLTATVVALRSRSGRSQFRVLVTSEPEEAARIAAAAAARAAALEAGRLEVAAAEARRAVLADTAAHYESQALAARLASEAAWEEEAHAAGFASGAEYGEFLVAETVDVPDTEDSPEPERDRLSDGELRDLLRTIVSPAPDREARIEGAIAARNANEAAAGIASTDSHRSPAPATLPCYHVTTAAGEVYGVAATSVRDALQMTQDRLAGEGSSDLPKGARKVGRWAASYGTVLHY